MTERDCLPPWFEVKALLPVTVRVRAQDAQEAERQFYRLPLRFISVLTETSVGFPELEYVKEVEQAE